MYTGPTLEGSLLIRFPNAGAAKAGVVLMSKSAALENAEQGIRVNIISPGLTFTPLLKNDPGFDIEYGTLTLRHLLAQVTGHLPDLSPPC